MAGRMAYYLVVESGRYAVAHSDEAMVGRMAAVRAEMMDARAVGLKVDMMAALKVEMIGWKMRRNRSWSICRQDCEGLDNG